MPIYDYECPICKVTVVDVFAGTDDDPMKLNCGHIGKRLISMSGSNQNTANQDADWIHNPVTGSVAIARNDDHPAAREFVKDPTRKNLNKFMEAKGLRHMDPGETPARDRKKRESRAENQRKDLIRAGVEKIREQRSITVRG